MDLLKPGQEDRVEKMLQTPQGALTKLLENVIRVFSPVAFRDLTRGKFRKLIRSKHILEIKFLYLPIQTE